MKKGNLFKDFRPFAFLSFEDQQHAVVFQLLKHVPIMNKDKSLYAKSLAALTRALLCSADVAQTVP